MINLQDFIKIMWRTPSLLAVSLLLVVKLAECDFIVEPGAEIKSTQGAVWPKPQQQEFNNETYSLNPYNFVFVVSCCIYYIFIFNKIQNTMNYKNQ